MNTIIKHRKTFALVVGLFAAVIATSTLVSYLATPARAGGLPTIDPLFYSGFLTDKAGKPLTGKKFIGVVLWDAATSGKQKCTTVPTAMNLVQGRFRLALNKSCVAIIQDNSELWVEVVVDGTSMGRTKIGAVPYVATIPDTLKVSGDASFTIHSNTDKATPGSKMLALKTGEKIPKEVFTVNNEGSVSLKGSLSTPPGSGGIALGGILKLANGGNITKTISGGAITVTGSFQRVATEKSAPADDLVTIGGVGSGNTGAILFLVSGAAGQTITLKHNKGNIYLVGGADITLTHHEVVLLVYEPGFPRWLGTKLK